MSSTSVQSLPSTTIKPRKNHLTTIIKGITHQCNNLWPNATLNQQIKAIGIAEALSHPELTPQQAIQSGMDRIKTLQCCSTNTSIVVSTGE